MSEMIPSESGDYNNPDVGAYAADFTEWENELSSEPQIAELSAELARLSLASTIDYKELSDDLYDPRIVKKDKEVEDEVKQEKIEADPLPITSQGSEYATRPMGDEEAMFSAAMGLIYFTTGIPVEKVFEES